MKILVAQEKLIFIKYTMYVALSANSNHCYFLAGFPRLLFDLLCQRATSCLPVLSLPWPGRACHPRRPAAVDLPELSVCAKPQKMQSIWAAQWANRSLQTVALPFSRLLARGRGGVIGARVRVRARRRGINRFSLWCWFGATFVYYCNGNHHWPCLCLQGNIVAVGTLQSQLAMIAVGMSLQLIENQNQKLMLFGVLMTNQCCCLIMKAVYWNNEVTYL